MKTKKNMRQMTGGQGSCVAMHMCEYTCTCTCIDVIYCTCICSTFIDLVAQLTFLSCKFCSSVEREMKE